MISSLPPRVFAALALLSATAVAGAADLPVNISLVGNATRVGRTLQLTSLTPTQAGAAWVRHTVDVTRSFEVSFSFTLVGGPGNFQNLQADGIAFVIQNAGPDAIGGGGGNLGFQGLTSAASEIKTYDSSLAGITTDGDPLHVKPFPGPVLGNCLSITGEETVRYDASAHRLLMQGNVGCDGLGTAIKDSQPVDLTILLGTGQATIGMTGGTGDNFADQRVTAFAFRYLP